MIYFYFYVFLQIVTETLPISSSGHMQLVEKIIGISWADSLQLYAPSLAEYCSAIDYLLHIPMVVLIIFTAVTQWRTYVVMHMGSLQKFVHICLVFSVTTTITILFFILQHSSYAWTIPLPCGFFITLVALASTYYIPSHTSRASVDLRNAVILGMVQGVSLLPGISRFAAVLVTALWLGITPSYAFFLTWLLALPLFSAAGLLGVYQLYHHDLLYALNDTTCMYVVLCAMVVGACCFYAVERLVVGRCVWMMSLYMVIPLTIASVAYFR